MKYIIYKIQIKDYIYIGSTKDFTRRKAQHKRNCINGEALVYKTIRENGGWNCCTIGPVKEIEVETKIQARIAEEESRVEYNAQMNIYRAYQTVEERKEQKNKWADKNKDYFTQREKTIERIEYHRQRNQTEERKEYYRQRNQTEERKEYNKQLRQTPEYKEYQKQYRLAKKLKSAESSEIKVEA